MLTLNRKSPLYLHLFNDACERINRVPEDFFEGENCFYRNTSKERAVALLGYLFSREEFACYELIRNKASFCSKFTYFDLVGRDGGSVDFNVRIPACFGLAVNLLSQFLYDVQADVLTRKQMAHRAVLGMGRSLLYSGFSCGFVMEGPNKAKPYNLRRGAGISYAVCQMVEILNQGSVTAYERGYLESLNVDWANWNPYTPITDSVSVDIYLASRTIDKAAEAKSFNKRGYDHFDITSINDLAVNFGTMRLLEGKQVSVEDENGLYFLSSKDILQGSPIAPELVEWYLEQDELEAYAIQRKALELLKADPVWVDAIIADRDQIFPVTPSTLESFPDHPKSLANAVLHYANGHLWTMDKAQAQAWLDELTTRVMGRYQD